MARKVRRVGSFSSSRQTAQLRANHIDLGDRGFNLPEISSTINVSRPEIRFSYAFRKLSLERQTEIKTSSKPFDPPTRGRCGNVHKRKQICSGRTQAEEKLERAYRIFHLSRVEIHMDKNTDWRSVHSQNIAKLAVLPFSE
jgi:hypothetical protein